MRIRFHFNTGERATIIVAVTEETLENVTSFFYLQQLITDGGRSEAKIKKNIYECRKKYIYKMKRLLTITEVNNRFKMRIVRTVERIGLRERKVLRQNANSDRPNAIKYTLFKMGDTRK